VPPESTRAKAYWSAKDLISNIFCKTMQLVYQKLKETKFFLDIAAPAGKHYDPLPYCNWHFRHTHRPPMVGNCFILKRSSVKMPDVANSVRLSICLFVKYISTTTFNATAFTSTKIACSCW